MEPEAVKRRKVFRAALILVQFSLENLLYPLISNLGIKKRHGKETFCLLV